MQIPPTTALLNLANTLPVQGVTAAPPAAKGPKGPQVDTAQPVPTATNNHQPPGRAHRGSIVNILA